MYNTHSWQKALVFYYNFIKKTEWKVAISLQKPNNLASCGKSPDKLHGLLGNLIGGATT